MFWPGHRHQPEGNAAPSSQADDDDEEEYNQELVDWLDIIGTLTTSFFLLFVFF